MSSFVVPVAGILVAVAPLIALAQAPDTAVLDDSIVQAAIEVGRQAKKTRDVGYHYNVKQMVIGAMGTWGETIEVSVRGPRARVAAAASDAAHRYASFTAESVSTSLRSPFVEIIAQPQPPFGTATQPVSGVKHIVLQTRDRTTTVQPVAIDTIVQTWSGGGTTQRLQGLRALFTAGAVPAGEFQVVIILGDEREHRQRVDAKARAKIFGQSL